MTRRLPAYALCLAALSCALPACSNEDDGGSDVDLEKSAIRGTKDYVTEELEKLVAASEAIQKAAPAADADGWNPKDDAQAVEKMRAAWGDARDAYERVEGSIAILFEGLDVSTDERYDGFIEGEGPDDDLFDGKGVTGMHAIERILWAGDHPETVIKFESALEGYKEAAFPSNKDEAEKFKNELAKLLVDDTHQMLDSFEPVALDAPTAFYGVIGSMGEQLEKVTLATTAQDESRYAQRTLDDMRANLEGGEKVYAAFRDWVKADAGDDTDAKIMAGFKSIEKAYADNKGSAIPAPPKNFDSMEPSDADLETPFGKLYGLLTTETDLMSKTSLINVMNGAANDMKLEELAE
jgi:iron uptake system component EfeO